jgi:hypothetical protein
VIGIDYVDWHFIKSFLFFNIEWGTITFASDQIEYHDLPLALPGYTDNIAGCCNNGRSDFMLGVNGSDQVFARAYATIRISYALWY